MQPTNIVTGPSENSSIAPSDQEAKISRETYCEVSGSRDPGHVVLRDGSTIRVRKMQPTDDHALANLFESLSEESRWLRFFSLAKGGALAAEARRETNLDRTFGLIALSGPDERIVGHAFYAELGEQRAEVAFTIADDFQRRGLGTMLLGQLAEVAAASGVHTFEAEIIASNHAMLNVFRESGFPIEVTARAGQLQVTMPTSFTADAIERFERRESTAAVNALKLFFNPRSIAVIGASRKRGTIGGEVFHNLLGYGFTGPVYPVNPTADVIQSVVAYRSVEEIPGPVDLAVIVVPEKFVVDTVKACGRKGVNAVVVISAGFGETGSEGQTKQAELVQACRAAGMRLIGPNCMGIINADPDVRMDATFAPGTPPHGRVGFSSQSGALGLAIIELANSLGLGLSTFVSVGNKADVSGNDLLRYWESDPNTDVILLYLESFGNPRKFSQIARRVGRKKPIVVVKSGRSAAGARATSSHTGALLAASDLTVDALFRQSGVIRTDTLEELFDVASLLVNQPLPKGNRVGIITNAGGPGILCADTCEARGLEVPLLSEASRQTLRNFLPPGAGVGNPVDMIASASAEDYARTIEVVAADPNIDALIVCFTPPLVTRADDVARAAVAAIEHSRIDKPVLTVFLQADAAPEIVRARKIPAYQFPETAAIALARAARYAQWRQRPEARLARFDNLRRDDSAAIVAVALERGDGWLTADETARLLGGYGLPLIEQAIADTPERAAQLAEELNGPIVLKVIAPRVLHKTEAGGVRLNLSSAEEVRQAANEMRVQFTTQGNTPTGYLVQRMAQGGVEMLVGVVHDPQFGPVIACGAGGVQVELLRDVSIRLAPLSIEDASEMVRSLKTYPLLDRFRGGPAYDVSALEDALLRVSAMVEDLPQIAELDLNPFVVKEKGAVILDARVRVETTKPRPLLGMRR